MPATLCRFGLGANLPDFLVAAENVAVNASQRRTSDDRSMTKAQPPVIFSHSAEALSVYLSLRPYGALAMGYIITHIGLLMYIQAAYPHSRASAVSSSRLLATPSSPAHPNPVARTIPALRQMITKWGH